MIQITLKNKKRLDVINWIYQALGIVVLIVIVFVQGLGYYKILFFSVLIFIFLRLLRFRKIVVHVEFDETKNEFILTYFNKRKIKHSNIFYDKEIDGLILLDSRKRKIVKLNRFDWSNYDVLAKVLELNFDKAKQTDSLLKEIVKTELIDPTFDINEND